MSTCWKALLDRVLRSWIGVPFWPNGRSRDGADCVGFVFGVLNELHGTSHQIAASPSHDGRAMAEIAIRASRLFDYDDATGCEPEAGDVIVVRNAADVPAHVGIIGGDGIRFWHASKAGVCFTGRPGMEVMKVFRPVHKEKWNARPTRRS